MGSLLPDFALQTQGIVDAGIHAFEITAKAVGCAGKWPPCGIMRLSRRWTEAGSRSTKALTALIWRSPVKKQCTAVLIALCAATALAAQTDTSAVSLLNVGNYSNIFRNNNGLLSRTYIRAANADELNKIFLH
jgi:hypothetical protein